VVKGERITEHAPMLSLDQIVVTYSAKSLRPPIVLNSEREWAIARRPAWLPDEEPVVDHDFLEIVDDDGHLDNPKVEKKHARTWFDLVITQISNFEAHYSGQFRTYAEWGRLWRAWWAKIDPRKYFPDRAPRPAPYPYFRTGCLEFERALAIGTPDEVTMWRRFGIAQFHPEDPRLVYLTTADHNSIREQILTLSASKFPDGVVCLTSALLIHGLIDEFEGQVWMGGEEPPLDAGGIRYFSGGGEGFFVAAHEEHVLSGAHGAVVHVTTAARSIVDCFSWHESVGLQTARKALRTALLQKIVTPDDVWKIAEPRKVAGPLVKEDLTAVGASRTRKRRRTRQESKGD
jgi:hypothetical protein